MHIVALVLPGLAVAAPLTIQEGHIYATSYFETDVRQYDPDGQLLATLHLPELNAGEETKGLGFGLDGRLYVVLDALYSSARLVAIDPNGRILSSYPLPESTGGNLSFGKVGFADATTAYVGSGSGLLKVNLKTGSVQNLYSTSVYDLKVMPTGNLLLVEGYGIFEHTPAGARVRGISLSDPNRVSSASYFSVNDLRGVEYDADSDRLYVTMLGNSDNLFFKTMAFRYSTGVLQQIATYNYGDDMFLASDGTLVLGSRTNAPWILRATDLSVITQLPDTERMFVTRYAMPDSIPGIAYSDRASLYLDTPTDIDVLANDVGFASPVDLFVTSPPQHGTTTVINLPEGLGRAGIRYTPVDGYTGPDSFVYQATGGAKTDTATVAVTVRSAKAVNDSFTVVRSVGGTLKILDNDLGFKDPVTVSVLSGSSGGAGVSVNGSPGPKAAVSISYYPAYGTPGPYSDTFRYQVGDGANTDAASVTVQVVEVLAQDDAQVISAGSPGIVDVLANDLGFGYPRSIGVFTNPVHGTVAVTGPGGYGNLTLTYTPQPGFLGYDSFIYFVDDGTHVATATVEVRVITDADGDMIDDGMDNCLGTANADQRDSDGDGYGNWCDADLNNDLKVNFGDLALFRTRFGTSNGDTDFDGNGIMNFSDLARFRTLFGRPPGPSARAP
jgi:hypothetical protein